MIFLFYGHCWPAKEDLDSEIFVDRPSECCIEENSLMASLSCRLKRTCYAVNCDWLTCKPWSWSQTGQVRWFKMSFRLLRKLRTLWCIIFAASGWPNTTTGHLNSTKVEQMPGEGTVNDLQRLKKNKKQKMWVMWKLRHLLSESYPRSRERAKKCQWAFVHIPCCVVADDFKHSCNRSEDMSHFHL